MRIKQISVVDLFGIFNHVIPLNMNERITIIHGPNGFGKTILLKMLDGLFNSRYSQLRAIPFKEFRIEFDDQTVIWVNKIIDNSNDKEKHHRRAAELTFHLSKPGAKEQSFSQVSLTDPENISSLSAGMIERAIPELAHIGPREWLYLPTQEILSMEDVIDRFSDILPLPTKSNEEPKWWKDLKDSINIRFIETQRLLNISHPTRTLRYDKSSLMVPAVIQHSKELAQTIKSKLAESAELSQSLDRTFPKRLVEQEVSPLADQELRDKLIGLEAKRSRLKEAGLLDKEEDLAFQVPPHIDETTKNVLSVYINDVEKKLSIFDTLADKIDLFSEIVNNRFSYKRMAISKERGFTFTTSGNPLSPEDLSSGEQHELVLLYELLFHVEPDSLILIDEPELSLHVGWQVQFLKDLQEITRLASFDVLIATHSPDIIHDRWDLTVKLNGPGE